MTLGSYALLSIGWALFVFVDTPEAGEELDAEVKRARAFFSSGLSKKLAFEVGTVPKGEGSGKLGMN